MLMLCQGLEPVTEAHSGQVNIGVIGAICGPARGPGQQATQRISESITLVAPVMTLITESAAQRPGSGLPLNPDGEQMGVAIGNQRLES